jgi:hypothetical protein
MAAMEKLLSAPSDSGDSASEEDPMAAMELLLGQL